MAWYDSHVVYGGDVLRPYLEETGIEVHKIILQLEDGKLPQEVVQENYDIHEFLDTLDSASPIAVEGSIENVPALTVEHVEAAIDYARDHESQVQRIIEEQRELNDVMFQPPEEAHEDIQDSEFEFFNVDSTFYYEEDGTPVVEFHHEQ
jgi:uncharacterized protein (DUF433 family)